MMFKKGNLHSPAFGGEQTPTSVPADEPAVCH